MVVQIRSELDEYSKIVHPHQPVRGPEPCGDEPAHQKNKKQDHRCEVLSEFPMCGIRLIAQTSARAKDQAGNYRRRNARIMKNAITGACLHVREAQQTHSLPSSVASDQSSVLTN